MPPHLFSSHLLTLSTAEHQPQGFHRWFWLSQPFHGSFSPHFQVFRFHLGVFLLFFLW
ncbi:hypothetical protein LOK49_LG07G02543 [Camellia lanceoleosa]|uniref:Uncharacterized protein n=1 Tax=Camellia lanceoleosa TaxID=1840588 RepID=A0ACC0H5Z0_9ERIC|nr:hypothetical protein LOK49_LG07G02543 [Camellia lanceoleosa]